MFLWRAIDARVTMQPKIKSLIVVISNIVSIQGRNIYKNEPGRERWVMTPKPHSEKPDDTSTQHLRPQLFCHENVTCPSSVATYFAAIRDQCVRSSPNG